MWGTYGDTTQDYYQKIFLVVSLLAVPLMLLPKPLYEIYCQHHDYKKIEDDHSQEGRLLSSESIDEKSTLSFRQAIVRASWLRTIRTPLMRSSCIS